MRRRCSVVPDRPQCQKCVANFKEARALFLEMILFPAVLHWALSGRRSLATRQRNVNLGHSEGPAAPVQIAFILRYGN